MVIKAAGGEIGERLRLWRLQGYDSFPRLPAFDLGRARLIEDEISLPRKSGNTVHRERLQQKVGNCH